ncbi:hypothetical protein ABOM_003586 [Aspergillus bombycis]|uniref:Uncharacterized protein n=1 Tax=Aspergillus bombycis TaxID=109264 RepID=A0A1F8AD88_9EURO|nr:hypothetical protein ABOM_003586 [Aspergillus bombycis]OGM49325.1 hypothetical protein ABOM_003586 [Aspergillus bombycis]
MRFIPLALGLMATTSSVIASPTDVQSVTVQLSNEQSGANANVDIPTDGNQRSIQSLWGHTDVTVKGVVTASSAQFNKFQQTSHCKIVQQPDVNAELNAQQTWVSLNQGKLVQLSHGHIRCWESKN